MRKILTIAGIVLLCMPTLFVSWLLAAARLPALDPLTMHLPMPMRSLVAEVAMKRVRPYQPSPILARVLRLDPSNPEAWRHRCNTPDAALSTNDRVALCARAASFGDNEWVEHDLGDAQLANNNPCAAEDAYRKATSIGANLGYARVNNYSAGKAGLLCGDFELARASFAAALFLDDKRLQQEGAADTKVRQATQSSIAHDNGGLSIAYRGKHQDQLSQGACVAGFPDYKTVCRCDLDKDNHVTCSGR